MEILVPETGLLIWNIVCLVFLIMMFYILYLVIKLLRNNLKIKSMDLMSMLFIYWGK